jgi:hypothetical protein
LLALTLSWMSLSARADPQADLKALIDQGKPMEAYQLGSSHTELLGDPSFDFFFGVAAIDAGHSAEGVMALERYLLAYPTNHQARLELARGYFILGEDARAREEFEAVLALNPPKEVVSNVERYMDAIRSREARYQTSARAYVEAGLGMDSNVNGGVSSGSITLPVLGTVQVGSSGQRQGDWVNLFGAGAQVTQPIAPGVIAFGGVDWAIKDPQQKTAFSTDSISVNGGGSWILGNHQLKAAASYSTLNVGHNHYQDVAGLGGEWQQQLSELQTVSAGLQYAQIRYTGANDVRDSDLTGATVGFRQALAIDWQPVISASMTVADDENQRQRSDLGRMLYSARLGVTASPAPQWGVSAGLTYQENRYKTADLLLVTRRKDRFAGLDLSVSYLIDRNWLIRTDVSLIDNSSNLALYAFRRSAVGVKLRYEFK